MPSVFTLIARVLGGCAFGLCLGRIFVVQTHGDALAFGFSCGTILGLLAATIDEEREKFRFYEEVQERRQRHTIEATDEERLALVSHLQTIRAQREES